MNNVISYTGINAELTFDSSTMMFEGYIDDKGTPYYFYATTLSELKKKYEDISLQILKKNEIREELATQLISLEQIVQSGEARIHIDPSYSDLKLGTMIRMLLDMSDGAAFTVSSKN